MKRISVSIFTILLLANCTGTRPNTIGVNSGKLTNCPNTPNCVSSQAEINDKEHYRSHIIYKKPLNIAKATLKEKINSLPRTKIISEDENYIYAEFTSKIMRYVDDVEFYFNDKTKELHFRSASRLGKSDFGVNRKRIETILEGLDI
ncbi:DUF1499 domain-containing protein [Leptospira sp. 96542]|nr:DUF1499 domain-containing protein [Leptospira sp. 96542]